MQCLVFVVVEVLALLAKQQLRSVLERMVGRQDDDEHVPSEQRPRQKQRRVAPDEVAELSVKYTEGMSVLALAEEYGIHRTTVMAHLEREGIPRRPCTRRMSDEDVQEAASYYATGESLLTVGLRYGVTPATVAREFRKAGVETRKKRGVDDATVVKRP